jgi:hypothetical protein
VSYVEGLTLNYDEEDAKRPDAVFTTNWYHTIVAV